MSFKVLIEVMLRNVFWDVTLCHCVGHSVT